MGITENHSSSYALGPPWIFKGSALYQLHLVKAETARAFIPKEFKIVEAFGYTLGGFFLASYDDSPAARFDELVVIAGLIWNPPTSCAWAARVIVNSNEACEHGRKEVGLPSHVGIFSKRVVNRRENQINKFSSFLDMIAINSDHQGPKECTEIQVSECCDSSVMSLCSITMPYVVPKSETDQIDQKWLGPVIRMSLPSFSGQTVYNPNILKYTCQIECRVRPVQTAKISGPVMNLDDGRSGNDDKPNDRSQGTKEENAWNQSVSVLLSKPILALEFSHLKMQVEAPTVVIPHTEKLKE